MNRWVFLGVVLGFWLVAFGRLTVPGHDLSYAGSYEACAHLYIGVLFGLMLADWRKYWPCGLLIVALTGLETVCFLTR